MNVVALPLGHRVNGLHVHCWQWFLHRKKPNDPKNWTVLRFLLSIYLCMGYTAYASGLRL